MNTKTHPVARVQSNTCGASCLLGIVAIIGFAACAPAPEPTHQTVDYYRANREVREAKVAECANDPGSLGKTPDCINAKQAAAIEGLGSLRDMKPLGLFKEGTNSESGSANTRKERSPRADK